MIPALFTIILDDAQRAFLHAALDDMRATSPEDEELRVSLRDMLNTAESGDVVNDFTL